MTRPEAMRLAREMYGDGDRWSVAEIQRYLNERDVPCVWETVKGWVDPEWRERRNSGHRESKRRYWRERNGATAFRVVDEHARAMARARLRAELGLTDEQVELVLDVTGLAEDTRAPGPVSPFDRMRELRDGASLSYSSIAALMRHDHGENYSPEQIRYALNAGHLPNTRRAAA